jgi:hypothetical protein
MKSERRHELEHNELADWLGQTIRTVKPYTNMILGGLALVVASVVAYGIWSRVSGTKTAAAWDELALALEEPEKLAAFIEKHPGTDPGYTAMLVQADIYLGNGCYSLFVNKPLANNDLQKATDLYLAVRDKCQTPALRERAFFGLARAYESTGRLEDAEKCYKQVSDQWPDGALAPAAAVRLRDLQKKSTKAFYDRFVKFEPKMPAGGATGERPAFDPSTLTEPPTTESGGNAPKTPMDLKDMRLDPSAPPAKEPEPRAPEPNQPEPKQPESKQPEAETKQPETKQPEPEVKQPGDAPPPAGSSDAPKPDAPKSDAPATEPPKPDAPKPEAPKPDEPAPSEMPGDDNK